jgi:hypothetical protein
VALEMSSFKCGHDAPIYSVIESIIEQSKTPYFSFKDIDENKPTGSIRIRVETIGYFLKRYREDLVKNQAKKSRVAAQLRLYEEALRQALSEGRSADEVDLEAIVRASEAEAPAGGMLPEASAPVAATSTSPALERHENGVLAGAD